LPEEGEPGSLGVSALAGVYRGLLVQVAPMVVRENYWAVAAWETAHTAVSKDQASTVVGIVP